MPLFPIANFKNSTTSLRKIFGFLLGGAVAFWLMVVGFTMSELSGEHLGYDKTLPATNDISYLKQLELHLNAKARGVLYSACAKSSTDWNVDLSLELSTAQTTVTSYEPGPTVITAQQLKKDFSNDRKNDICSTSYALTGNWTETSNVRPEIKRIRCLITLPKNCDLDHDLLYKRLTYALGLDLARGDVLQII